LCINFIISIRIFVVVIVIIAIIITTIAIAAIAIYSLVLSGVEDHPWVVVAQHAANVLALHQREISSSMLQQTFHPAMDTANKRAVEKQDVPLGC
jgi:hypothetical protein